MKIVKFAAGFAAGYVLGSKAGREKYEQIVETARRVRGNPAVQQAQQKAKEAVGTGVDTAKAKMDRRHAKPARPVEPVEPVDLTTPV
jgi:hypothetical protein